MSYCIVSFGRSGSTMLIDRLFTYRNDHYRVFPGELFAGIDVSGIHDSLTMVEIETTPIICKYVFTGVLEADIAVLKAMHNRGFTFILILRNAIDVCVSNLIAKQTKHYSHLNTTDVVVDLHMNELYTSLNYHNKYLQCFTQMRILPHIVLYEQLSAMSDEEMIRYVNEDIFAQPGLFCHDRNATMVRQNKNPNGLYNVSQCINPNGPSDCIASSKRIQWMTPNARIEHYYQTMIEPLLLPTLAASCTIVVPDSSYFIPAKPGLVLPFLTDDSHSYVVRRGDVVVLMVQWHTNSRVDICYQEANESWMESYAEQWPNHAANMEWILESNASNIGLLHTQSECHPGFAQLPCDAFVVHLERDLSRLVHVDHCCQFAKRTHLVQAISAHQNTRTTRFCTTLLYRRYLDAEMYKANFYDSYTFGSIALTLSVLLVLRYCLSHRITQCMIFEDDVIAHRNIDELSLAMAALPDDADVLCLGIKQDFRKPLKYVNDHWYIANEFSWGAYARSIQRKLAMTSLFTLYATFARCIDCYHDVRGITEYVSAKQWFVEDRTLQTNIKSARNDLLEKDKFPYPREEYVELQPHRSFEIYNHTALPTQDTWKSFVNAIALYQSPVPSSLVFFDFVDREFGWDLWKMQERYPDGVPFAWAGIVHHPFVLPDHWNRNLSVSVYMAHPYVQRCLRSCRCLIVLGPTLQAEMRQSGLFKDIPIRVLRHVLPTFSINTSDVQPPLRKLTFLGWSFRNFRLFAEMSVPSGFTKHMLLGVCTAEQKDRVTKMLHDQSSRDALSMITIHERLPLPEFAALLCGSIVFLDFDGVVANNSVIECIHGKLPLLVRDCPAVRFYLGNDYPMYYKSLIDINRILLKWQHFVLRAREYLACLDTTPFSYTSNVRDCLHYIDDALKDK